MESNLREARKEQIQNKEHFLVVQAARDRAEFERVLKLVLFLYFVAIRYNVNSIQFQKRFPFRLIAFNIYEDLIFRS